MKKAGLTIRNFLIFFLTVALVSSCCLILFINMLQDTIGREFTREEITLAAKLTMIVVILISMGMALIDHIRRKITVERPVSEILAAAEQIISGDFSVRIDPISQFASDGSFQKIINCLNTIAQELGSVETLRTDFIANVSHEMKTPLAVIQNYGTLLQDPCLPEEKRMEYAKGISNASGRLAEMMTNILKLNRLENQQIFPAVTKLDLGEQLCQCLLQFESVWEQKGIEIETDIKDDVIICADGELLSLVWNNLLSNAFKFTEKGTVSVTMTADADHAVVTVKDTGCGISPETGEHIFEKFYQGDTSRCVQGNGLGLALVKRVIDIVHGTVSVESYVGRGSTFTVVIPRS